MTKSIVSIAKGTDPEKMVAEALANLGGVTALIKPGTTVVIKPNAIGMYTSDRSITTSPEFVAAVIKELRKANPKKIIMAESSAMSRNSLECLEKSGLKKAAEDAGIDEIRDTKADKDLIKLPLRNGKSALTSFMFPRFLIEADHIVNLPIFKCHVSAVFSCCLKNIKGTVQDKIHLAMHQTDLAEAIIDAWTVIQPDLQIVDMIRVLEGFGPIGGLPLDFGCVVAGKDPTAVDATCCRMTGIDIAKCTVFDAARNRHLGHIDEEDIEVRGEKIKDVFKQIWTPHMGGMDQWPEYHIHSKGSCSSCQALLAYGMERLKSLGEYDKNKGMDIYIGHSNDIPENFDPNNTIFMGDCVKKHRNKGLFIEGCPPLEMQPTWMIMDRKYEDTYTSKRKYGDETQIFREYAKKKKIEIEAAKAAEAAKTAKKK
jgi:uncharacterized protein (DUF362 family)